MTKIEFTVEDIYDKDQVLMYFQTLVVVTINERVIAVGELGQSRLRDGAERIAMEAYERAAIGDVAVEFSRYY